MVDNLMKFCFDSFITDARYIETNRNGRPYHIETNPLICSANHWTGFYMIGKFGFERVNTIMHNVGKWPNVL